MSDLYERVAQERANHESVNHNTIKLRFPLTVNQLDPFTIEVNLPAGIGAEPFSPEFIEGLQKQIGVGPAEAWIDKHTKRMAIDLILAQVR